MSGGLKFVGSRHYSRRSLVNERDRQPRLIVDIGNDWVLVVFDVKDTLARLHFRRNRFWLAILIEFHPREVPSYIGLDRFQFRMLRGHHLAWKTRQRLPFTSISPVKFCWVIQSNPAKSWEE